MPKPFAPTPVGRQENGAPRIGAHVDTLPHAMCPQPTLCDCACRCCLVEKVKAGQSPHGKDNCNRCGGPFNDHGAEPDMAALHICHQCTWLAE